VIINIYDSPTVSSYKIKKAAEGDTVPTLSKLDSSCSSLPQESLLFIAGDLNTRTGGCATLSDYNESVIKQLVEGTFTKFDQTPTRISKTPLSTIKGEDSLILAAGGT
jgi:hypothetical protein